MRPNPTAWVWSHPGLTLHPKISQEYMDMIPAISSYLYFYLQFSGYFRDYGRIRASNMGILMVLPFCWKIFSFFSTWNGNSLDPSHFVPPIVFFEALKQWARPPMVVRLWPEHPMCRLGKKHLVDGQDAGVPHNCFCLIFGYPLLIEQSSGKLPIY